MVLVRTYLLNISINIVKKLAIKLLYLKAKYEADEYATKTENFDLRAIPDRIKNVLLHDKDIIAKRLDECQSCEHFIKSPSRCNECGCFMKVKTRLATARCPIGKWEKEYDFIKGKKVNGIIHTT